MLKLWKFVVNGKVVYLSKYRPVQNGEFQGLVVKAKSDLVVNNGYYTLSN